MLLRIQHETKLTYTVPVSETVFEVRMAPPSNDDQTALSYQLQLDPSAPVTSYRDGCGNRVDLFNVATPYRDLVVRTTSFVRTHRRPVLHRVEASGAVWSGCETSGASVEAVEFLQPSPLVPRCPEVDAFVSTLRVEPGPLAGVLEALMEAVGERLDYEKSVTRPRSTVAEALSLGKGVCQDFTHLMIAACRALGLPARYVSGYLNLPGEIATHAWCQVWAGEVAGWVDVDPTHGEFVGDDHVTTAVGRDYHDVPPNRGLWKGLAEESITVSVTVDPVERVPSETNGWQPAGLGAFGAARGVFQRQGFRQGQYLAQFQSQGQQQWQAARERRRGYVAYPHQPSPRANLHQQQAEQQQQQ
jgi:transglutaminase-like putative cysteine protease